VSTPLAWSELRAGAVPRDFTLVTVPLRLSQQEDPWSARQLDRVRVDLLRWRSAMMGERRAG
jgi:DNA primase